MMGRLKETDVPNRSGSQPSRFLWRFAAAWYARWLPSRPAPM